MPYERPARTAFDSYLIMSGAFRSIRSQGLYRGLDDRESSASGFSELLNAKLIYGSENGFV